MKKIMILGGGYYQLPLIKTAKKIGYYTIVCGINGNYHGYQYADKWYDVDTFDKEACLKIALDEKINGICVCGTDTVLPTLGYIVGKLNLKGPSLQSAILSSNKALMKERFIKYGVRTAKYEKIYSFNEIENFIDKYGFPIVLKVVDASGSRGVAIVHEDDDIAVIYGNIITKTQQNYILIEEYIVGEEFGAQAFIDNGKFAFIMPHGDIVFKGDTGVPIGHYVPYEKEALVLSDVTEQIEKCVKALDIDNAALNVDFILKDGLVYVLEIGARAGATCLPELVSCYYGIDYYEYILRKSVGDNFDFFSTHRTHSVVETLISDKSKVIKNIVVPKLPEEVVDFQIYYKIGDHIRKFENAYDRIGHVVLKGRDTQQLYELLKELNDKTVIE